MACRMLCFRGRKGILRLWGGGYVKKFEHVGRRLLRRERRSENFMKVEM